MSDWQLTGRILPATLVAARRELHTAVQVVSAVGRALVAPRDDDSHTALAWSDALDGFLGEPLADGSRAGLIVPSLVLCIVRAGAPDDAFPLGGRTLSDARDWLAAALDEPAFPAIPVPDFLVAQRPPPIPFVVHAEFAELARYYADAARYLASWSDADSPLRTWPHHFDIAVLRRGPHDGQTIGIGMSPGDAECAEPYWYVAPWPRPTADALPPLAAGGTWHTGEWVGALLMASRLTVEAASAQERQVAAFVESAVAGSRAVLAGS